MEGHCLPLEVAAELNRLRAETARLAAENAALKFQLKESDPSEPAKSAVGACTSCGALCSRCSSPVVSLEAEAPVFPNEIFVIIGAHMEPGTRSLLNLALASRALYELLLPRLYERFSLATVCSGWQKRLRSLMLPNNFDLPRGSAKVQTLDLSESHFFFDNDFRICAIEACSTVEQLVLSNEYGAADFHALTKRTAVWPLVEKLSFGGDFDRGNDGPATWPSHWDGMPNLREIRWTGEFSNECANFIAACFPRLETIIWQPWTEDDFDLDSLSPDFVAKVTTFEVDLESNADLGALRRKFPSFRPTTLTILYIHSGEDLPLLADMDSVQDLKFSYLPSSALLDGITLPPHLKRVTVKQLGLKIDTDDNLNRLVEFFRCSKVPEWRLGHFGDSLMDWTEEEVVRYFKELQIWEQIPGFRCRLSEPVESKRKELGL